jgi:hypothetical protein
VLDEGIVVAAQAIPFVGRDGGDPIYDLYRDGASLPGVYRRRGDRRDIVDITDILDRPEVRGRRFVGLSSVRIC